MDWDPGFSHFPYRTSGNFNMQPILTYCSSYRSKSLRRLIHKEFPDFSYLHHETPGEYVWKSIGGSLWLWAVPFPEVFYKRYNGADEFKLKSATWPFIEFHYRGEKWGYSISCGGWSLLSIGSRVSIVQLTSGWWTSIVQEGKVCVHYRRFSWVFYLVLPCPGYCVLLKLFHMCFIYLGHAQCSFNLICQ